MTSYIAEDNASILVFHSKKIEARERILTRKKVKKTRQTANSFTCPDRIVILRKVEKNASCILRRFFSAKRLTVTERPVFILNYIHNLKQIS